MKFEDAETSRARHLARLQLLPLQEGCREILVSLDHRPALRRLADGGGTRGKNVERAFRHRTR